MNAAQASQQTTRPQLTLIQGGGQRPTGGSPMHADDRHHLDEWQWTPERLAWSREQVRKAKEHIWPDANDDLERLPAGQCDECEQHAPYRKQYGHFQLCNTCTARRHKTKAAISSTFPANDHETTTI